MGSDIPRTTGSEQPRHCATGLSGGAPRSFRWAFATSLGVHGVLLCLAVWPGVWSTRLTPDTPPLEIIYQQDSFLTQLQNPLGRMASQEPPDPVSFPGSGKNVQIQIPERPLLRDGQPSLQGNVAYKVSGVVDLANLMEAAQGDAVLLSYFSAIRERIEKAARDHRDWLNGIFSEGLVYVSFVINPNGSLQEASVVLKRSCESAMLHELALRFVRTAGPFAPFPPSIQEPRKTIVIPLEFRLRS